MAHLPPSDNNNNSSNTPHQPPNQSNNSGDSEDNDIIMEQAFAALNLEIKNDESDEPDGMDTSNNNNNTMAGGLGFASVNNANEYKEVDPDVIPAIMENMDTRLKMEKLCEYYPWYSDPDATLPSDTEVASLIIFSIRAINAAIDCFNRKHWEYQNDMYTLTTRLQNLVLAVRFNSEFDERHNNNNNNNENNENDDSNDNNNNNNNNT